MKLSLNIQKISSCKLKFEQIIIGDIFIWRKAAYIKIFEINLNGFKFNSINLMGGQRCYFNLNESIGNPVSVELITVLTE